MTEPNIVTLLASATEIVCALGFENSLVARSHECDYPVSVAKLPACTESKIDTRKDSGDIDNQVKSIVEQGLSVYRVNGDLLQQLQPDIIITQTQCEVCAVSPKDLEHAVRDWMGAEPRIVSLEPNGLADVWTDIQNVAEALGTPDRGERLVAELQARMGAIEAQTGQTDHRPSVACIEWINPLMAAGNWMPELVAMAGGENVFGEAGRHSPWMTWEALCETDPEVIIILPCGYNIKESRRNMAVLIRRPEWSDLKAVTAGRVYIADGNQYFNRPGPRLAESLEILAELLHPELFDFGHEGVGWERL
ncbi:MAG: cobalamin-binding protein [Proteobacteria bacterium]|nr:cobalamin-binding protein [Pseudomonadota bacterium]